MITPIDFEQLVNKQAHLLKFDLSYRSDLWSTTSSPLPDDIQQIYKQLLQEIEPLRNLYMLAFSSFVAHWSRRVSISPTLGRSSK